MNLYPVMTVFAIDKTLQEIFEMKHGYSHLLGLENMGELSANQYFFKAQFYDWHHSQKYPFCILDGIKGEDEEEVILQTTDDLDAAKRAIMEDFGFISGSFKSNAG